MKDLSDAMYKKLEAAMARRNKKFAKMTAPGKRVQIAKDVIKALAENRIQARTGAYLVQMAYVPATTIKFETVSADIGLELQKCEVCAIGGIFVAAVHNADKLDFTPANDPKPMRKYLSEWFSLSQQALIEAAFERGAGCVPAGNRDAACLYCLTNTKLYFDAGINLSAGVYTRGKFPYGAR